MLYDSISQQLYVFLSNLYLGAVCALVLVFLKILLRSCKEKRKAYASGKPLFFSRLLKVAAQVLPVIACGVVWFFNNLRVNYGIFRVYAFLAFGLGLLFYFTTCFKLLAKAFDFLYTKAKGWVAGLKRLASKRGVENVDAGEEV